MVLFANNILSATSIPISVTYGCEIGSARVSLSAVSATSISIEWTCGFVRRKHHRIFRPDLRWKNFPSLQVLFKRCRIAITCDPTTSSRRSVALRWSIISRTLTPSMNSSSVFWSASIHALRNITSTDLISIGNCLVRHRNRVCWLTENPKSDFTVNGRQRLLFLSEYPRCCVTRRRGSRHDKPIDGDCWCLASIYVSQLLIGL